MKTQLIIIALFTSIGCRAQVNNKGYQLGQYPIISLGLSSNMARDTVKLQATNSVTWAGTMTSSSIATIPAKPNPYRMQIFDAKGKTIAHIDSLGNLHVTDSLATIKQLIRAMGNTAGYRDLLKEGAK